MRAFTQQHYEIIAALFQSLANDPAYQPSQRPDQWQVAIVTLLAKTPQASKLDDFRPISLIPQLQKVYSRWLYTLFLPAADSKIPPTQHGFRPRRQCAEIHHIFGKLRELGQEWRMRFVAMKVDVRKAFDTISRGSILQAMSSTEAHPKVIWALSRELLSNKLVFFQVFGVSSPEMVQATKGVKQGSPESGLLYGLTVAHFLEPVIREWETSGFGHRVGIKGTLSSNVSFADDLQLLAKSPPEMAQMYATLTATLASIGLSASPQKTQYISNYPPTMCEHLLGMNCTGKGMVVLGKLCDVTDTTDREIARREVLAWAKFRKMMPVLQQKSPIKHRLRILQACILQTMLWGAETWIITKKRLSRLRGLHFKMPRRIIVPPGYIQGLSDDEKNS